MKRIRWSAGYGLTNAEYRGTFEVDDDATVEEIDELVLDAALERVEVVWEEEK